jgi:dienelactone hydrolase
MMNYKMLLWVILAILILSACQSSPTDLPATTSTQPVSTESIVESVEPQLTMVPTITETIEPKEEPLTEIPFTPSMEEDEVSITAIREEIEASDGLILIGTYYTPADSESPWPGVILLHMLWSDRSAWDEYAYELAGNGFAVFALDMRGHGETGGEVNWDLAAEDIRLIWDNLSEREEIDPARMGIVGASIGANMALVSGANEPEVRTVILLSPGLSYAGVETTDAIKAYGERSVFIVASQEDTYAADSSEKLNELALGESKLEMYQDAGHGTFMLENQPELRGGIIDWLRDHLQ